MKVGRAVTPAVAGCLRPDFYHPNILYRRNAHRPNSGKGGRSLNAQ